MSARAHGDQRRRSVNWMTSVLPLANAAWQ
jgi:hypothetical protein